MLLFSNWIADENPFSLEQPPNWWLQRLSDFDPDLVVLPSRQKRQYRIARRARLSGGMSVQTAAHNPAGDIAMLIKYTLVPVTTIVKTGPTWEIDNVLNGLRARDIWRAGGADAMADKIEAEEAAAEQKRRDATKADLQYRARDGYRTYKARTGQSTLKRIGLGEATRLRRKQPLVAPGSASA